MVDKGGPGEQLTNLWIRLPAQVNIHVEPSAQIDSVHPVGQLLQPAELAPVEADQFGENLRRFYASFIQRTFVASRHSTTRWLK